MLKYKIFVFFGLALISILIIENMIMPTTAYLLWDNSSKTWIVSFFSAIIGGFIGFGIFGWMNSKNDYDEENDDMPF